MTDELDIAFDNGELSVRAINICRKLGLNSKDDVRAILARDRFHELVECYNCGRVTISELRRWAFPEKVAQAIALYKDMTPWEQAWFEENISHFRPPRR
jgi:hypothetical protein